LERDLDDLRKMVVSINQRTMGPPPQIHANCPHCHSLYRGREKQSGHRRCSVCSRVF
jgi:hypothetical protein